jgi:hypothetical protein
MLISHLSPVIVEHKAFFLRASWLVPISAPPIRDGALLVRDGRIAAIGKAKDIVPDRDCLRLEFPDGILLPGFVNPHTHLENTHFADKLPRRQPFVSMAENDARFGAPANLGRCPFRRSQWRGDAFAVRRYLHRRFVFSRRRLDGVARKQFAGCRLQGTHLPARRRAKRAMARRSSLG